MADDQNSFANLILFTHRLLDQNSTELRLSALIAVTETWSAENWDGIRGFCRSSPLVANKTSLLVDVDEVTLEAAAALSSLFRNPASRLVSLKFRNFSGESCTAARAVTNVMLLAAASATNATAEDALHLSFCGSWSFDLEILVALFESRKLGQLYIASGRELEPHYFEICRFTVQRVTVP